MQLYTGLHSEENARKTFLCMQVSLCLGKHTSIMFLCMQVLLCLDIHASKCFCSILTQLPDVISICHLPFTSPMPRISALRACTSARRQLSHSRASSRARLWKFWYWNWLLSTLTSLTSPPDTRLPFIDDGLWEAGNRNSFYNKIIKIEKWTVFTPYQTS